MSLEEIRESLNTDFAEIFHAMVNDVMELNDVVIFKREREPFQVVGEGKLSDAILASKDLEMLLNIKYGEYGFILTTRPDAASSTVQLFILEYSMENLRIACMPPDVKNCDLRNRIADAAYKCLEGSKITLTPNDVFVGNDAFSRQLAKEMNAYHLDYILAMKKRRKVKGEIVISVSPATFGLQLIPTSSLH